METTKVLVPLANGFEEIEAVSIIDVLRRADIDVLVASIDKNSSVKGAHGIIILSDMDITEIDTDKLNMIVLPGGWGGTYALAEDSNVQTILRDMNSRGKDIGAICAAPYALDKAGVLKSSFTCYPSVEEKINNKGYMGDQAMVIEDENIMTSRGPATAICFALKIVEKLKGKDKYFEVKNGLLADYCQ